MTQEEEIKNHLFSHNPEFRRLVEEHHGYEAQLRELSSRPHVNDAEQLKEITIKKKKLHLKDRMSRMIEEYRQGQATASHS